MRRIGALLVLFLLCATFVAVVRPVFCQTDPSDVVNELLSNPVVLFVFVIQFGLGLGLGYFSVKALKYIIAILAIIALGLFLNIWQFGGLEGFLEALNLPLNLTDLIAVLTSIVSLLGILTFLPIGVGFFLGAIAAAVK